MQNYFASRSAFLCLIYFVLCCLASLIMLVLVALIDLLAALFCFASLRYAVMRFVSLVFFACRFEYVK